MNIKIGGKWMFIHGLCPMAMSILAFIGVVACNSQDPECKYEDLPPEMQSEIKRRAEQAWSCT